MTHHTAPTRFQPGRFQRLAAAAVLLAAATCAQAQDKVTFLTAW